MTYRQYGVPGPLLLGTPFFMVKTMTCKKNKKKGGKKLIAALVIFLMIPAVCFAQASLKGEDAPHTSGDVGNLCLVVRSDEATLNTDANGDYSTLLTDNTGRLWVNSMLSASDIGDEGSPRQVAFKAINVDGADSDEIIAAVGGFRQKILTYVVVCDGATTITFEDTDGTDLSGAISLAANGGISANSSVVGLMQTSVGKGVKLLKSAAVNCDGHISYVLLD